MISHLEDSRYVHNSLLNANRSGTKLIPTVLGKQLLSLNFCLGLKNELTFSSNAIAMLCIMCESATYMVLLYVYYLVNKGVPSRYIFSKTPGPKSEIIFNGLKTEKFSGEIKPKVTIYL